MLAPIAISNGVSDSVVCTARAAPSLVPIAPATADIHWMARVASEGPPGAVLVGARGGGGAGEAARNCRMAATVVTTSRTASTAVSTGGTSTGKPGGQRLHRGGHRATCSVVRICAAAATVSLTWVHQSSRLISR